MLMMLMLMVMVTSATELDDGDAVSASVGAVDGAETVREEEDGRDACAHAANANASASALEEFRYFVLGRTLSEENMCRCFPTWSRGVGEAQAPSQSEVKAKKHHRAPLLSLKAYKADMEEKMAQKREKEAKQREKEEREKEAATAAEGAAAVTENPADGDENVCSIAVRFRSIDAPFLADGDKHCAETGAEENWHMRSERGVASTSDTMKPATSPRGIGLGFAPGKPGSSVAPKDTIE